MMFLRTETIPALAQVLSLYSPVASQICHYPLSASLLLIGLLEWIICGLGILIWWKSSLAGHPIRTLDRSGSHIVALVVASKFLINSIGTCYDWDWFVYISSGMSLRFCFMGRCQPVTSQPITDVQLWLLPYLVASGFWILLVLMGMDAEAASFFRMEVAQTSEERFTCQYRQ